MKWLMAFLVECYQGAPAHLNVQIPHRCDRLLVHSLEAEVDELWSFVGKKANPQWLWLALEARSGQMLAFHVGDRSQKSARLLWNKLPAAYRQYATFYSKRVTNPRVDSGPEGAVTCELLKAGA
jgi:insertion element IS1 protein InsB